MPRWTPTEFALNQARNAKIAPEVEAPRQKPKRESDLHRQITQEIRRRGWIACHGAMYASTKRTPGEPDFHVLAAKGRHFMVEVKTATGKLSEDQEWFKSHAHFLGHQVFVVRSLVEFIAVANAHSL